VATEAIPVEAARPGRPGERQICLHLAARKPGTDFLAGRSLKSEAVREGAKHSRRQILTPQRNPAYSKMLQTELSVRRKRNNGSRSNVKLERVHRNDRRSYQPCPCRMIRGVICQDRLVILPDRSGAMRANPRLRWKAIRNSSHK